MFCRWLFGFLLLPLFAPPIVVQAEAKYSSARPWPMAVFTPPEQAQPSQHRFEGRLTINQTLQQQFTLLIDSAELLTPELSKLPGFAFEFVQIGNAIVPVQGGVIATKHSHWEYILSPGRVWQSTQFPGYSQVSMPFSLQEKNENCVHNGVLSFAFNDQGTGSVLNYQISSETCGYLKFDWWGQARASYQPLSVAGSKQITRRYLAQQQAGLPVHSMAQLKAAYPRANTELLGSNAIVLAENMTLFGFVIDGVNYVGGCDTRAGPYPFCQALVLPSYSLAKSIFAGLTTMLLQKTYPQLGQQSVAQWVPQCSKFERWSDVSFEQVLDMSTGLYTELADRKDEFSKALQQQFFNVLSHQDKIRYACNVHAKQSAPGKAWVYHTSDTYILGTALDAFVKSKQGKAADLFNDVLRDKIFRPLQLSATSLVTKRSYDSVGQSFTGFGLNFLLDDIARLAVFINADNNAQRDGLLDQRLYQGAMQKNSGDRGYRAGSDLMFYNNGFWALNVKANLACGDDLWLPFMTGYGGINVVLLPNDTVYYYFSDGGTFSWIDAAKFSHQLRPLCLPVDNAEVE